MHIIVVVFVGEKSFLHLLLAVFAGRTRTRNTLFAEQIFLVPSFLFLLSFEFDSQGFQALNLLLPELPTPLKELSDLNLYPVT